jgi:hypothetical protein
VDTKVVGSNPTPSACVRKRNHTLPKNFIVGGWFADKAETPGVLHCTIVHHRQHNGL